MKKKYLALLIVIVISMMPIGCKKENSKDVVLATEKVVIDDNTKEKKNEDFQIKMVGAIDSLDYEMIYSMLFVNENIIQLNYQYPNNIINEVRVGKLDSNNNIEWSNKNTNWKLYENFTYNRINPIKVKKDNKVYTVDKEGELVELICYTKLIEEKGEVVDNNI